MFVCKILCLETKMNSNISHLKNLSLCFLMYKISGVMVTKGFGKKKRFRFVP